MAITNDPVIAAMSICTDDRGYDDEKRAAVVERAKELAIADGGGIAQLPRGTVDSLIGQAAAQLDQEAKRKAMPKRWTDEELDKIRDGKNTFSKRAVAAGDPAARRTAYIKKHGLAEYEAEQIKWQASTDVRVPGKSPYKGIKGLKKALRGEKLEDTGFNRQMHGENVFAKGTADAGKQSDKKSTNPYKLPMDDPTRIAKISAVMARMPTKFVNELAKAASCSVSGRPIVPK
jgi:hypothetical protein